MTIEISGRRKIRHKEYFWHGAVSLYKKSKEMDPQTQSDHKTLPVPWWGVAHLGGAKPRHYTSKIFPGQR
jgi:hypothetical protein